MGGDGFVSAAGLAYEKDRDFVGGTATSTADAIANTSDDTLYQTERYGNYSYQLPVAAGRYRVTLKWRKYIKPPMPRGNLVLR